MESFVSCSSPGFWLEDKMGAILLQGPTATPVYNFQAVFSDNILDLSSTSSNVCGEIYGSSGDGKPDGHQVSPLQLSRRVKVCRNIFPDDEVCPDTEYSKARTSKASSKRMYRKRGSKGQSAEASRTGCPLSLPDLLEP